jgi:alkylation response protein AidB-like acyl-CoA dehydrogenase
MIVRVTDPVSTRPTDDAGLAAWTVEARRWLDAQVPRRPPERELVWGEGSDSVALFTNLDAAAERALVDELRAWQRTKQEAGYGSITWPVELGGAGLTPAHEQRFLRLEREYDTPARHEAVAITLDLVGPTILTCGSPEQQARYLPPLRRTNEMWCQLFSEPDAGSDLASVATRADRDGDHWVITGQKVWTSGAQFADFGYVLARSDPGAPRHAALTAFLVPMAAPGVEVRPLRQMTGGASFNEVFLDGLRVPDSARIGAVGEGWRAAITTLGFERMAATRSSGGGRDPLDLLVLVARRLGRTDDPVVRQRLADAWIGRRVRSWTMRRAASTLRAGGIPGPEGSIGKLAMTEGLRHLAGTAALVLGPRLLADAEEWGTYAWGELVNGVPGVRIAGGSDEIQRTIVAERVLGLPREPR